MKGTISVKITKNGFEMKTYYVKTEPLSHPCLNLFNKILQKNQFANVLRTFISSNSSESCRTNTTTTLWNIIGLLFILYPNEGVDVHKVRNMISKMHPIVEITHFI